MNRKYNKICVSIIFGMTVLFFSTTAMADSIKRANKKDIERLLQVASELNSAYGVSLIGETRGRVYIEFSTSVSLRASFSKNNSETTVYWIPSSELTQDELTKFKEYKGKT